MGRPQDGGVAVPDDAARQGGGGERRVAGRAERRQVAASQGGGGDAGRAACCDGRRHVKRESPPPLAGGGRVRELPCAAHRLRDAVGADRLHASWLVRMSCEIAHNTPAPTWCSARAPDMRPVRWLLQRRRRAANRPPRAAPSIVALLAALRNALGAERRQQAQDRSIAMKQDERGLALSTDSDAAVARSTARSSIS